MLDRGETQAVPDAPVGIPEAFEDHIKLMFDLLALAYQSETTRVSTLMYAKDLSPASYPNSGNRGGFHGSSHHANVRDRMDQFAADQQVPRPDVRVLRRRSWPPRPTATGRCSITRCSSTAAA